MPRVAGEFALFSSWTRLCHTLSVGHPASETPIHTRSQKQYGCTALVFAAEIAN